MTAKILKSQMFDGFEAVAASHAFEMKNWCEHMARVDADEKNGVTGIEKHVGHPPPENHPMIMSAVNENGDVDFEVIDDLPTKEEILSTKKNELIINISQAEQIAISMILPMGKRRLYNMRLNDIASIDSKTIAGLQPSLITKAAVAIGISSPIDITKELEKGRSADDTTFLKEHAERLRQVSEIERMAAEMHSEIDDLTLDNIDAWKPKGFKK